MAKARAITPNRVATTADPHARTMRCKWYGRRFGLAERGSIARGSRLKFPHRAAGPRSPSCPLRWTEEVRTACQKRRRATSAAGTTPMHRIPEDSNRGVETPSGQPCQRCPHQKGDGLTKTVSALPAVVGPEKPIRNGIRTAKWPGDTSFPARIRLEPAKSGPTRSVSAATSGPIRAVMSLRTHHQCRSRAKGRAPGDPKALRNAADGAEGPGIAGNHEFSVSAFAFSRNAHGADLRFRPRRHRSPLQGVSI